MEPTPVNATIPAEAALAQFTAVAHLGRSAKEEMTTARSRAPFLALGLFLLAAGCSSVSRPPDKWEFVAVRVDAFYPNTLHVGTISGPHLSFDHIAGTVVSSGRFQNQKMRFSRSSAEPLEVGQIHVVKLYEYIGRATREGLNPPEWCIIPEPNH